MINGGALLASATFTLNSNRGMAVGPTSGTGSGEIDVAAGMTMSYGGVIANNTGTGNLTVGSGTNRGTLILSGTNTYSGITTVNTGVLSIGTDLNLGAAPGSVTAGKLVSNGGTLLASASFTLSSNRGIAVGPNSGTGSGEIDVANGTTLTYGGIIANNGGTGCLTVGSGTNTGTLAISGSNTYTGGTTAVNAGTLLVNSTTGSGTGTGNVAVASGGTLGGTGNISGGVTIGGTLSPGTAGSPAGTLALGGGNLTLLNDAILDFYVARTPPVRIATPT